MHRFIRFACMLVWLFVPFGSRSTADEPEEVGAMVRIPAGPFVMGSDGGPEDERPRHTVTVAAFSLDRNKVTNAEFALFLNAASVGTMDYDASDRDARIEQHQGRWRAVPGHEQHPVVEVTWAGAQRYCAWRNKRLPTEAEWEKAARGTDGRKFPWGNEPPDRSRAHFGAGWNDLRPVGSFPRGASPYGALDMAGNGWEWVSSAYRPYPYRADDGREDPDADYVRGTRGGGHDSLGGDLTTTQRGSRVSRNPRSGHHNISFRCAR